MPVLLVLSQTLLESHGRLPTIANSFGVYAMNLSSSRSFLGFTRLAPRPSERPGGHDRDLRDPCITWAPWSEQAVTAARLLGPGFGDPDLYHSVGNEPIALRKALASTVGAVCESMVVLSRLASEGQRATGEIASNRARGCRAGRRVECQGAGGA